MGMRLDGICISVNAENNSKARLLQSKAQPASAAEEIRRQARSIALQVLGQGLQAAFVQHVFTVGLQPDEWAANEANTVA